MLQVVKILTVLLITLACLWVSMMMMIGGTAFQRHGPPKREQFKRYPAKKLPQESSSVDSPASELPESANEPESEIEDRGDILTGRVDDS